ncbi:MAG TPA: SMC family ATPase [Chloroflexus aurantiacus]|jgi:exonuclease SbcC|uniref:Nuclease SbcCD subunit C n=1 Tax=Chloroflexus aurantiacus (strain ATCC 29366 / DSM 635 / J-10-fl) TaxID=324602 RepID=A9WFV4_CHLAA|nr:SMC family ATPase [Chloroflexus aurantiacus]ABY35454.1 SMC domain protein [Chloroflexus aurantiacus J-10-fl]RMG47781.1 MAG: SMC family ATPase [Chloroflexota bacterium]GIV92109.1 MAG: chromosome segregation protein SMC [Chloroflexus sp.]HBW65721.1 SMC family ATPase [Chloroflexus aurantiacus]
MIPLQLALRNFMCYRATENGDPLRLDLDGLHVLCLSGENGAGKSTLLDAITWALWGEARRPDDDLITQGETEMMVELVFALDGRKYRVIRQRQRGRSSGRGTGAGKTWLDLQQFDGTTWRPIGENTIRETQRKITELLRMSYTTFVNASFLLQGRADEFTSKTPAERKEVLAEILDLAEYAELERRARERVRLLEADLIRVRGQLETLQPIANQVPFWQQAVAEAEQRQHTLQQQRTALEAEFTQASEKLRHLEQEAHRQREVQNRIAILTGEIQRYSNELRELNARIAQAEQTIAQRPLIEAGLAELHAARADLERLEQLRTRYDELMARKRELQQELKAELNLLNERLSHAIQQLDRLYAEAQRLVGLQQRVAAIRQRLRELAPVHERLVQCQHQRTALEQHLNHIRDLVMRQRLLQNQLEQQRNTLQSELNRSHQELARLDRQLSDVETWRNALRAAQDAQARVQILEAEQLNRRQQEQVVLDRLSAARAEAAQARRDIETLQTNQALLATGKGECPVCRRHLAANEADHVYAHYRQELERLQAQETQAKAAIQAAEQELKQIRSTLTSTEQELTRLRQQAATIESLHHQLNQAATWQTERDQLAQRIATLTGQLTTGSINPAVQAELDTLITDLEAAGDIESVQRDLRMLNDEMMTLEQQLREHSRLEGELSTCQNDIERIEHALRDLPAAEATVAELQRQIAENDFGHEIRVAGRQVVAELESLNYRPEDLEATRALVRSLTRWEQAERDLLLAEQRYATDLKLREQTQQLCDHAERERQTLHAEAEALAHQLRVLPTVQATVNQVKQQLSANEQALQAAGRDLAEKQAYYRQAESAAAEVESLQTQERQLSERTALFAELAEAFGKKGVQAMLIETAIPQLEDEANRLLARLTDGQMHLRFEMQRDTKKGDTVETLEVRIADALGTRDYAAFSGGEAMRVNFAIRMALSRLLAHRAGARLETLVIDEGFGVLDADGRERMVEAITAVQRDFARIIVITHIDDLKDRFPATLEIRKTPLGSRWELRG